MKTLLAATAALMIFFQPVGDNLPGTFHDRVMANWSMSQNVEDRRDEVLTAFYVCDEATCFVIFMGN